MGLEFQSHALPVRITLIKTRVGGAFAPGTETGKSSARMR